MPRPVQHQFSPTATPGGPTLTLTAEQNAINALPRPGGGLNAIYYTLRYVHEETNGRSSSLVHLTALAGIAKIHASGAGGNFLEPRTYVGNTSTEYLPYSVRNDIIGDLGEAGKIASDASWTRYSGLLTDAAKGKGNLGIGYVTVDEANMLGKAWVSPNYTVASDGKTLISANGLRQYRPPSFKPNLNRTQANLESRLVPKGQWQSNAHVDIIVD